MPNITLIGAGSMQFGLGTLGDIFCTQALHGSTVTLLDIDEGALDRVYTHVRDFLSANDPSNKWGMTIRATSKREEALQGADFIIISIEVGNRFDLWDMDRYIPQQYGIRQVYGENGGPGGTFHALRIVPHILDICSDIERICPNAVVFNYSNPMSRVCTTVHRKFPDLRFFGLCHEIASLERYLPSMLETTFSDLRLTSGGLNHFSVLLIAKDKDGRDIYPDIRKKAHGFFRSVPSYGDFFAHQEKHGTFIETEGSTILETQVAVSREWAERTLFRFILDTFDLLPITTDSHFGEYITWAHDVAEHRGILDFYRYYRKHLGASQEHKIELQLKERVACIMGAMVSGEGHEEAAINMPNGRNGKKYISELPGWICVEVPAKISKDSVEGIALPPLPKAFAGLLTNQIGVHDMNAEAILQKSKRAALHALLVDPVVNVCKGIDEMLETVLEHQREFLGYLE